MAVTLTGLALLALRYGRIDPTFMLAGFLIYGLGQGLAQPALVSRVVDARGVSAEEPARLPASSSRPFSPRLP
jgi:hypothetical protein